MKFKLSLLLVILASSPMAFSNDEQRVRDILSSKIGDCPIAQTLYKDLKNKKIEVLSPPYARFVYIEVSGNTPSGIQILLELTWQANCNPYGPTGCSNTYQCRVRRI